jgi:two-component SAPR family response regulator
MEILIIDNNLEEMDEIKQLILNLDPTHNVETVHFSYDAIKKIQKHHFDIIFCEIYLQGGINGNQIIESAPQKVFKIGMAEKLENPNISQPFNHFIIKPITKEKIKEAIGMAKYNMEYLLL